MTPRLTPLATLAAVFTLLLAVCCALVWLASAQPWTGMRLAALPDGTGANVVQVTPGGPAALAGLVAGDRIRAIAGLDLNALDLVEEPDTLRHYDDTRNLYARQGHLHQALRAGPVTIEADGPDGPRRLTLTPGAERPLSSLPVAFWLQLGVGAAGLMIGAWVWSLRQRDLAAQLTAAAGAGLAVMVFPAAVYSTRDLALDPGLFHALSAIDHAGALMFGVAMTSIFFVYPHRILPAHALWVLPVVIGLWWLADTLRILFPGPPTGFHLAAFLMLLAFLPAAAIQHRRSRREPDKQAALRWFTIAVTIGTGTFVAIIVVPNLFGFPQWTSQANAFLLLLIVFAGIGLSVARYRLFELENWAFGLLYNLAAIMVVFALDAALIYLLAFNRQEALGVALLLGLLAYLPLRDRMRRYLAGPPVERGALFQKVVDVALTPPDMDQNQRWADLLRQAYNPLHLQKGDHVPEPVITDDGLGLVLPSVGGVAAMRLSHARGGRHLFSREDRALAQELCAMLDHALESRYAREAGVAAERARIARDMHDNIGAKLLSALHHPGADRKDTMIRDALSDFRAILNDAAAGALDLDEALADLRVECAERLETAGIALDWRAEDDGATRLPAHAVHTFRSILREAVSNVLRHAGATRVTVTINCAQGRMALSVKDNGRGFATGAAPLPGHGHGLTNIRTRLEALNGDLHLDGDAGGVQLRAAFSTS